MRARPFLLDVNVLLALAFPNHLHHRAATQWLEHNASCGIRTCPFTEAGFIRIASNPALKVAAVSVADAILMVSRIHQLPHHAFWPADIPLPKALAGKHLFSHRQVTDAYLVALAAAHAGALATFDRAIPQLEPAAELVHLIASH